MNYYLIEDKLYMFLVGLFCTVLIIFDELRSMQPVKYKWEPNELHIIDYIEFDPQLRSLPYDQCRLCQGEEEPSLYIPRQYQIILNPYRKNYAPS